MTHLLRDKSDRCRRWHGAATRDAYGGVDDLTAADLHALDIPDDMSFQVVSAFQQAHDRWLAPGASCTGSDFSRAVKSEHYATLDTTDTYEFVEWYRRFRRDCELYDIPLMPFEAINPAYEADGLFPPGLGIGLYDTIGRTILPIVERVLPSSDRSVRAQIRLVNGTTNNAYDLLWKLATVTVPIFDLTLPVVLPVFDTCIFQFAEQYSLHNQLLRHRRNAMSDYDLIHSFLINLSSPRFRSMAASRVTTLEHMESIRDATGATTSLPSSWSLDAIAADMDRKCPLITSDMGLRRSTTPRRRPYVPRRVNRFTSVEPPPDTSTSDGDSTDDNPEGHIQGYSAVVRRAMVDQPEQKRTPRYPDPAHTRRRRERAPFFEGQCRACGRYGHKAVHCDFLAMFVWMQEYWKNKDPKEIKEVERRWTERNAKFLENEKRSPTRISMAYCYDCDVKPEELRDQLDWEYFSGTAPEEDLP